MFSCFNQKTGNFVVTTRNALVNFLVDFQLRGVENKKWLASPV